MVSKIDIPEQGAVVNKYGNAQFGIAMEECAELIQAVSKHSRYNCNETRANLIEEISDVLLCIEQLKIMAKITPEEIQKCIDTKWERTKWRLGIYKEGRNEK